MNFLSTLLIGLILIGCTTSGEVKPIHTGMTRSEVIHTLGEPVSSSVDTGTKDHTEYLNYKLEGKFQDRTIPYYVHLINGKVNSSGYTDTLISGRTINTDGMGTDFSAYFYVDPVTHEIHSGSYETKFETDRSQE